MVEPSVLAKRIEAIAARSAWEPGATGDTRKRVEMFDDELRDAATKAAKAMTSWLHGHGAECVCDQCLPILNARADRIIDEWAK